ncbi:D-alanyl-D-alanine carboxypeptidase (penicillin-binding protein 5/6) [Methylohalomonas lacus]|uniref:serine-type D-Ala-D-Ala carboxypeptidase n=1 Tax=Methylohalomonas lacus TaxID=398773 RepID=A0AAE3L1G6_9GAMM|nr:D-alanyl-D-alanine carboxypeptidase family protein [Methylohalomonas lacus]MCS3903161.1 D-alanyl-D-alanine carboxypeptidase (penicillin-binding protein 5/6) [Methylohalomonas lacus]
MNIRKKTLMLVLVAVSLLPELVTAQNPARPSPPSIDAQSYLLVDYASGRVIAEKDAAEEVEPASLTKMMTVYVAGEELQEGHIKLDDEVLVSEKAWRMPGSRMFIEVNTRVTVEQLLNGIIIQSGNDASVALAEHISGSEEVFAQLMNQTAQTLGLENTHFTNSTGMPEPGHVTTAQDMAKLSAALIRDYPELYGLHEVKEYTYNDITQPNRNQLLWRDNSVDGIKTGHTEAAGYCLVASAERDDMRLISVVMGANSVQARTSHTKSLLNYGFRFFETRKIADGNQKLGEARIWKGTNEHVNYGLVDDVFVTVPRGDAEELQQTVELKKPLIAPVAAGEPIGTLSLGLGDETLLQQPLVTLQAVEQAGLFSRLLDSVKLMLE